MNTDRDILQPSQSRRLSVGLSSGFYPAVDKIGGQEGFRGFKTICKLLTCELMGN
jgi:hypothetical protein